MSAELLGTDRSDSVHEPSKVTGDYTGSDGLLDGGLDASSGLLPAEVTQEHSATQEQAAGVRQVLTGDVRSGTVSRFEEGVACLVVDVGSRCDTDTTDLSGDGVRSVVPVEVGEGYHLVASGVEEHLLEEVVSDDIGDDELTARLKRGWEKYQELGRHSAWLSNKIRNREALLLSGEILRTELNRVRSKRSRLHAELSKQQAAELTKKLSALPVKTIHVEELSWLSGSKGKSGKGGRWSYARQQADLQHSLARQGITLKKKNPRNSSQVCFKCGGKVTYSKRSVWCDFCKKQLDRDFNAAMNLATLNHLRNKEWLAKFYGFSEVNCSVKQVNVVLDSPKATVETIFAASVAKMVT